MSRLLTPFMPYIIGALVMGALGLAGYVWWLRAEVDALASENASLTRSVVVLEGQIEQSKLAREVADAEAARVKARAAEYDALRETLMRGDDDAPLPEWFRDYLDRLLGGLPNAN